jgi:sugar transferase (PEP-CTERM/EpsH1 system associated)
MNLLILAPQWPDPPRQGAAIRNLPVATYLAGRHKVTLLAFAPEGGAISRDRLAAVHHAEVLPRPTRTRSERLRTLLASGQPDMASRLGSSAMRDRVRELCRGEAFDAVHVEGIEMAPYGLLALESGCRAMTYDAHNAEYLLQRRVFATDARNPRRLARALYSLAQWRRLRRFEARVCLASAHILAVSEPDRVALARLAPAAAGRIAVLPNGVDTEYWSPAAVTSDGDIPPGDDVLVFDGSMDFRPNVDAALWFVNEAWPRIRQEKPGARFYIVGRNPAPEVLRLGNRLGITVTGAVEDPRPWVARAGVYVVPMRMGGGVRLKVLQAMAMERAIVSTPMGAEGIAVKHGREMLLAGAPETFARSVIDLMSDPERRAMLGRAARALAVSQYDWRVLLPLLDAIYPCD